MDLLSKLTSRLRGAGRQPHREGSNLPAGWHDPSARSEAEAVFIGGCQRSGTTMLRELLGRHPRLACGPETALFWRQVDMENLALWWGEDPAELTAMANASGSVVRFADAFFGRLLKRTGKARFVDKTPGNVRAISTILTWYPRGRFLHVVRDGRDTACSLRHYPSEVLKHGRVEHQKVSHPIDRCATQWLRDTSYGLAFRDHPRCFEVNYERLVADPAAELAKVCAFLNEEPDPAMLEPATTDASLVEPGRFVNAGNAARKVEGGSVGRWRQDLTRAERDIVAMVAGELLVALGYVRDGSWVEE